MGATAPKAPTEAHAGLAGEAVITLEIDGGTVRQSMARRTFNSGSIGYSTQAKVSGSDGRRFQVNVNAVLIGSKPETA